MTKPQQMTSSLSTFYSIVSGCFFAACAYAQANDPDPALWVLGYVWAGCVVNLLVRYPSLQWLVRLTVLANGAIVVFWTYVFLVPDLDFKLLSKSPLDFVWSILELEQGREVVGLLLLWGHGLLLQSGTSRGGTSTGLGLVALAVLGLSVYLWRYYQPTMNAKYQVEHCSGQFHQSVDGLKLDL